jgi:hypothetical protein
MKTLKLLFALLIITVVATSCEKEAGPAGPAGTNGTNGNANVTVYSFGQRLFNAGNFYIHVFTFSGMTSGEIDSSLFMPYYKDHGNIYWYQAGQLGPGNAYQTRCFIAPFGTPECRISLSNPDGSSYTGIDVNWDSVKIFVIPANTFRIAKKQNIDFKNCNEVSAHYNVK